MKRLFLILIVTIFAFSLFGQVKVQKQSTWTENPIQIQYSQNGISWHSPNEAGDYFMRISTDSGNTWSDQILIKGDQGIQGIQGIQGEPGIGQQGEQGIQGIQGVAGVSNYTIAVQALTSSPADGATVYFGTLPKAPITTANVSRVYTPAGTIKRVEIYCYSGTAGTAEAWSLYVRKNNTTDYLIATVSAATNMRIFSNSALNIVMNGTTDYIEIKGVQPTFATNPATTIYAGYLYFE